ncbi:MAG: hypothetical protein EAZ16_00780 [Sphingobacteriales bacterium]|nr:MAG: hypothetical protein EAZ16_00780 [Sphingobacteriales bacterium]
MSCKITIVSSSLKQVVFFVTSPVTLRSSVASHTGTVEKESAGVLLYQRLNFRLIVALKLDLQLNC